MPYDAWFSMWCVCTRLKSREWTYGKWKLANIYFFWSYRTRKWCESSGKCAWAHDFVQLFFSLNIFDFFRSNFLSLCVYFSFSLSSSFLFLSRHKMLNYNTTISHATNAQMLCDIFLLTFSVLKLRFFFGCSLCIFLFFACCVAFVFWCNFSSSVSSEYQRRCIHVLWHWKSVNSQCRNEIFRWVRDSAHHFLYSPGKCFPFYRATELYIVHKTKYVHKAGS